MKNRKNILLTLLVLVFAVMANAQVVPPPIPPPPPPGLPIDGGIVFLAISGLIFGAKKLKKKH